MSNKGGWKIPNELHPQICKVEGNLQHGHRASSHRSSKEMDEIQTYLGRFEEHFSCGFWEWKVTYLGSYKGTHSFTICEYLLAASHFRPLTFMNCTCIIICFRKNRFEKYLYFKVNETCLCRCISISWAFPEQCQFEITVFWNVALTWKDWASIISETDFSLQTLQC